MADVESWWNLGSELMDAQRTKIENSSAMGFERTGQDAAAFLVLTKRKSFVAMDHEPMGCNSILDMPTNRESSPASDPEPIDSDMTFAVLMDWKGSVAKGPEPTG